MLCIIYYIAYIIHMQTLSKWLLMSRHQLKPAHHKRAITRSFGVGVSEAIANSTVPHTQSNLAMRI